MVKYYRAVSMQLVENMKKLILVLMLVATSIALSGCLGFIVGNAIALGIEVV